MDPLTIILITAAAMGVIGLAFMSGWELGSTAATDAERALANRRINGLLKSENNRKPRRRTNRRASK